MKEGESKLMDAGKGDADIPKEMNPVEMLNRVACCFTGERLMASQVAVLTTIARSPSITSCGIVKQTGISLQNVGRILNYLVGVGDLTFIRELPKRKAYKSLPRHFYVTEQGGRTIMRILGHLHWGDTSWFHIVPQSKRMDGKIMRGD